MRTVPELIKYLHQACWSPTVDTWCKAIDRGYLATFPGLTAAAVRKHLPPSIATTKGHMRKSRQHVRSTTAQPTIAHAVPEMTTQDFLTEPSVRTNLVTCKTIDPADPKGLVATDQTGRFPIRSSRGNQYIMVAYVRDANAIIAIPIKNRNENSLVNAYKTLHDNLNERGLKPKMQICDNECPTAFKRFLHSENIHLQLVPPYDHRTNPAEKAIDTWKSHFIAGLASLPPTFPMHLWCRLIPHATTTLNLLRPSNLNPKLSAYAQLEGAFDFNSTPLAPPGCQTIVYESPDHRASWNDKGVEAWYLGPAMSHYRCHTVYVPKSRAERIARTVDFFPHDCAAPQASPLDNATRAADALTSALKGHQQKSPFQAPGNTQYQAIVALSKIFSQLVNKRKASEPVQLTRVLTDQPTTTKSNRTPVQQTRVTPNPPPHLIPPDDDDDPVTAPVPNIEIPDEVETPRYNLRSTRPRSTPIACAVVNEETGVPEEYPALIRGKDQEIWKSSYGNDICRLAQGMPGRPDGTDTIKFIRRSDVPPNKKVTYGKKECTIRPTKAEKYRVRLTVGGDKLTYHGLTATQCASLITTKILLNSTVSTPDARWGSLDIKNFYYGTPMIEYEYMKIKLSEIPQDVTEHYKLNEIVHSDGYVYIEIRKGMPGLKQAGRIANDRLVEHLAQYGYHPTPNTPALWTHETRNISFALVVDDFGVKYVGKENFDHLVAALKDLYEITVDEKGSKFLGLTIKFNYQKRTVDISMPGYVKKALLRFQHIARRKQRSPHQWNKPIYGQKTQYAEETNISPPVSATAKTLVQQVIGTFLYYGLALDFTMLVALSSIGAQQNNPTERTMSELVWFLDYCATNPEVTIRYHASDMILWTVSDASYLSESNARSRAGGLFYLSNKPKDPSSKSPDLPPRNGMIYALVKIMQNVMSSAMEAEVGAAFLTAKQACAMRTTLEELGHPQPATPLQVDNQTAVGFANDNIKHKHSKAIDMRFHWIRDRTRQGQFIVFWAPSKVNLADYVTKHHPPAHHVEMRKTFFHNNTQHLANIVVSNLLQGCDSTSILRTYTTRAA